MTVQDLTAVVVDKAHLDASGEENWGLYEVICQQELGQSHQLVTIVGHSHYHNSVRT